MTLAASLIARRSTHLTVKAASSSGTARAIHSSMRMLLAKGGKGGSKGGGKQNGGGAGKGKGPGNAGGWPSTTGKPSGGGRSNNPPSK